MRHCYRDSSALGTFTVITSDHCFDVFSSAKPHPVHSSNVSPLLGKERKRSAPRIPVIFRSARVFEFGSQFRVQVSVLVDQLKQRSGAMGHSGASPFFTNLMSKWPPARTANKLKPIIRVSFIQAQQRCQITTGPPQYTVEVPETTLFQMYLSLPYGINSSW